MFDNNLVTFNKPFILALIKLNSLEDIKNKLSDYAKKYNANLEETVYFFVRNLLISNLFFKMNRDIANELFFEAAYWASMQEHKQKTRPKNFNDIQDKKNQKFFTKLNQIIIIAITEEFFIPSKNEDSKEDNFPYKIELNKYIKELYEISCIKRNRKSN